ncbi:uncharacterized protein LOC142584350 isoform X2 [Dermacentor variabilis]|uniref:uncharacterized protein LOC142584350 isoform X2 n=1 Tax=Dermacentor variabilis TaxID=34621 RepID=UPI003F5C617B
MRDLITRGIRTLGGTPTEEHGFIDDMHHMNHGVVMEIIAVMTTEATLPFCPETSTAGEERLVFAVQPDFEPVLREPENMEQGDLLGAPCAAVCYALR